MDATLHLLREMAEQREYQALQQACADFLLLDNHPEVLILQMLALANMGKKDSAASLLAAFEQTTDLDGLSSFARLDMGSVYSALARFEEAENLFDGLIEQAFCLGVVLAKKAYCRLMQGDEAGAEALFVKALEHENCPLEVVINLCELHLARSSQLPSIDRVQAYLAHSEQEEHTLLDTGSEYQLGLREQLDSIRLECWVKQGQKAEAESWLRDMTADEPRYAQNIASYVDYLVDKCDLFNSCDHIAAEAILRFGLKTYPNNPLLLHRLDEVCSIFAENVAAQPAIKASLGARVRARFHPTFLSSRLLGADHHTVETPSYALGPDRLTFSPVFLLGLPCSGVSLLADALSEQMLSVGEKVVPCATSIIGVAIEGIDMAQRTLGTRRAYPDNLDVLTPEQIQGLAESIQLAYQNKSTSDLVIDTNLDNIHHLGFIKWLFPKAKCILVNQDVREWLASSSLDQWLVQQGLTSTEEKADCLGEQFADFKALSAHWQRYFSADMLTVSIEQWQQSPTETLAEIADFIGMKSIGMEGIEMEQNSVPSMSAYEETLDDTLLEEKGLEEKKSKSRASALPKRSMLQLAFNKALLKYKTAAPVTDMVTLPKAGLLTDAFRLYTDQQPRDAEYQCKVILHHLPSFAPAHYLLGELYLANGLIQLGIDSIERAISLSPWKAPRWQRNLPQAYQFVTDQKEAQ
ncbi:sulfotransferase [Marinomonas sp. A79]|uniref:Sulfotransferase n=1 Tax=Marinomonas vulgaris TaxID=2823372 RepID=A0ABS5HC02_9GAMM|nr:sulfotransferase [Marinomonas vulgaris]MBR7889165.1 sulfotransferase [Marinomonas vulgaris]